MPNINAPPWAKTDDRRTAKRYQLDLGLQYAVRRRGQEPITGMGRSLNLSRSGLLFRCQTKLLPGDSISAVLDWPASGPEGAHVVLVVAGYVVRCKGTSAAVSISRNELVRGPHLRETLVGGFRKARHIGKQTAEPAVILTAVAAAGAGID